MANEQVHNVMFDFIIIGGGPAGSTAATILSRHGHNVLVLEKDKFPRAHVGESMLSQAYHLFDDLGVLKEMKKQFVRKPGVEFTDRKGENSSEWPFQDVIKDESYLSFHVSRDKFDQMLLENSLKNGAHVLEGIKVLNVELNHPDYVLVGATGNQNRQLTYRGRFLIDASGQGAFLANKFNSKTAVPKIKGRIAINTRWANTTPDDSLKKGNLKIIRLDIEGGGWMWVIPIEKDILSIGLVLNMDYYMNKRKALQSQGELDWINRIYNEMVLGTMESQEILRGAYISEDLMVNSDFSYRNQIKYDHNFACIGDASCFVDPIFASGVYIALKSAFLVSEALNQQFKNNDSEALINAYKKIEGAYRIVEDLVQNFYDPEAIKIDDLGSYQTSSFEQQKRALQIFHLLISGKFFDIPDDYINIIELLRNEKRFKQFEYYVNTKKT